MINIAFSKLVKIGTRQWEVNFRKLPSEAHRFHADTPTLDGERIQFDLYKDQSAWHVEGARVPDWISGAGHLLGTAVEQGLRESFPQEAFD